MELIARRVSRQAFFGGKVSEETRQEAKAKLGIGLKGLARLAAFGPYVFSEVFSAADCAAWPHFRLVGKATGLIYGEDLVATHLPEVADYLVLMESRPAVQRVAADRDQALEIFYASRKP